jgi:hypothetical protein
MRMLTVLGRHVVGFLVNHVVDIVGFVVVVVVVAVDVRRRCHLHRHVRPTRSAAAAAGSGAESSSKHALGLTTKYCTQSGCTV